MSRTELTVGAQTKRISSKTNVSGRRRAQGMAFFLASIVILSPGGIKDRDLAGITKTGGFSVDPVPPFRGGCKSENREIR